MKIPFKTPYTPRDRVFTEVDSTDVAHQSFKDECDINNIMSRWEKTGVNEHVMNAVPQFADLTEVVDYQTALNVVREAELSFSSLPPQVRKHFENNPALFMQAVESFESGEDTHVDTFEKLGLLQPRDDKGRFVSPSESVSDSPASAKAED